MTTHISATAKGVSLGNPILGPSSVWSIYTATLSWWNPLLWHRRGYTEHLIPKSQTITICMNIHIYIYVCIYIYSKIIYRRYAVLLILYVCRHSLLYNGMSGWSLSEKRPHHDEDLLPGDSGLGKNLIWELLDIWCIPVSGETHNIYAHKYAHKYAQ